MSLNHTEADLQKIARINIRHFVVFRLLFNARFYYPVFAVIFLDFGLSLEQFALLNVIWAVTIILAEVPSGALSDLLGRKRLLVFTSTLMVFEMAVWAFAPTGNPTLLFWILALNRILSGLGEASASGSDEALVYDSLESAGMQGEWSKVLETVTRWQSVAFMLTMVIGGLVYDPGFLESVFGWLNPGLEWDKSDTLRIPLYLTLATAILCWFNNLRFVEMEEQNDSDRSDKPLGIIPAFRQTAIAGKWILKTPFALVIILAGAFADSVIRMFVTLGSEYYRLIEYPEFALGFIGAGVSALNFFVAPISRKLVEQKSPTYLFLLVSFVATLSFLGASLLIPWAGILFAILLFSVFSLVSFAISYYLNRVSDKSMRATVLSFKGMALNLGYGFIGIMYSQLLNVISRAEELEKGSAALFQQGLLYFAPYFAIGSIAVMIFAKMKCPKLNQLANDLKSK